MITMTKQSKSGRPPQYVQFEGLIIVGLSGPKPPLEVDADSDVYPDGRYYSTHNDPTTGKREYFGRNLEEAVRLFKVWKHRRQKK